MQGLGWLACTAVKQSLEAAKGGCQCSGGEKRRQQPPRSAQALKQRPGPDAQDAAPRGGQWVQRWLVGMQMCSLMPRLHAADALCRLLCWRAWPSCRQLSAQKFSLYNAQTIP